MPIQCYASNIRTAMISHNWPRQCPIYKVLKLNIVGGPSLTGVINTARGLAFVPLSFPLAYIARGITF